MAILTPEAPLAGEGAPGEPIRTTIPLRDGHVGERRDLRTVPFGDRFDLLGSAAAALAVSTLLFGWLTPMTGSSGGSCCRSSASSESTR